MELIKSPNRSEANSIGKRFAFISIMNNDRGFRISTWALKSFVLTIGMRVVFAVDTGRLYFYLTKNDEGFSISTGPKEAGLILSKYLIKTLYERLPNFRRNGPRFGLRVSNTRINDSITFEILINKKLQ